VEPAAETAAVQGIAKSINRDTQILMIACLPAAEGKVPETSQGMLHINKEFSKAIVRELPRDKTFRKLYAKMLQRYK
jgi:hypothetical protein